MLTNEFRIFDPLKDDVNTVPTLSGNYIFALRKNSKLPDIGIPVIYTKFRDYEVIYVGLASTSLRDRETLQWKCWKLNSEEKPWLLVWIQFNTTRFTL